MRYKKVKPHTAHRQPFSGKHACPRRSSSTTLQPLQTTNRWSGTTDFLPYEASGNGGNSFHCQCQTGSVCSLGLADCRLALSAHWTHCHPAAWQCPQRRLKGGMGRTSSHVAVRAKSSLGILPRGLSDHHFYCRGCCCIYNKVIVSSLTLMPRPLSLSTPLAPQRSHIYLDRNSPPQVSTIHTRMTSSLDILRPSPSPPDATSSSRSATKDLETRSLKFAEIMGSRNYADPVFHQLVTPDFKCQIELPDGSIGMVQSREAFVSHFRKNTRTRLLDVSNVTIDLDEDAGLAKVMLLLRLGDTPRPVPQEAVSILWWKLDRGSWRCYQQTGMRGSLSIHGI